MLSSNRDAIHWRTLFSSAENADVVTVVKMVDFSRRPQSAKPLRRPNSSRRLRPGVSPRNTELIPAQAIARVLPLVTA